MDSLLVKIPRTWKGGPETVSVIELDVELFNNGGCEFCPTELVEADRKHWVNPGKSVICCCVHAANSNSIPLNQINDNGERVFADGSTSCRIGDFIPALPDGKGGYYHIGQAPVFLLELWQSLPAD